MNPWQVFGGPRDGTTIDATTNESITEELRNRGFTGTVILRQRGTGTEAIYLIRNTTKEQT